MYPCPWRKHGDWSRGSVEHYNHVRLHSAIGYVTPADKLFGLEPVIHAGTRSEVGSGTRAAHLARPAGTAEPARFLDTARCQGDQLRSLAAAGNNQAGPAAGGLLGRSTRLPAATSVVPAPFTTMANASTALSRSTPRRTSSAAFTPNATLQATSWTFGPPCGSCRWPRPPPT